MKNHKEHKKTRLYYRSQKKEKDREWNKTNFLLCECGALLEENITPRITIKFKAKEYQNGKK